MGVEYTAMPTVAPVTVVEVVAQAPAISAAPPIEADTAVNATGSLPAQVNAKDTEVQSPLTAAFRKFPEPSQ